MYESAREEFEKVELLREVSGFQLLTVYINFKNNAVLDTFQLRLVSNEQPITIFIFYEVMIDFVCFV